MSEKYEDKKIYGGLWTDIHPAQHTLLCFAVVVGALLAYYHHTWMTFGGAFLGTALVLMMRFITDRPWFAALVNRPAGPIRKLISAVFHKVARWSCYISLGAEIDEGKPKRPKREKKMLETPDGTIEVKEVQAVEPPLDRASAGYQLILRVLHLSDYCTSLIKEELPSAYRCLVFTGSTRTPAQYLQWGAMGLLMIAIFSHGNFAALFGSAGKTAHRWVATIPFELDFAFGLLILISTMRDALKDMGRKASQEVRELLPTHLLERLFSINRLKGLSVGESDPELSRLRSAVRRKSFAIGQFSELVRNIKEQAFTLFLLSLALLISYWPGAGLVYLASAATLQVMLQCLLAITRQKKGLRAKIGSVTNRSAYVEDPRSLPTLRNIAPKGAIIDGIHRTNEEIAKIKEKSRESFIIQRYISRLVFFSLFALSAIMPLYETSLHELNTRLALLYWISLTGYWYSMSIIADSASRIVEMLMEDLEEVEEAVEVIKEQTAPSDPQDGTAPAAKPIEIKPKKPQCPEMTLNEVRIGIPFVRTWLRSDPVPVQIPFSPGLCKVVKVLGSRRSNKSLLFDVLAGKEAPTSGSICYGNYESHERDRLAYFSYIPRRITVFPKLKILELFQEYRNIGPTPEDDPNEKADFINKLEVHTRKILADFDRLIDEIEVVGKEDTTGVNLLIGENGMFLDEEQNRMLFFALQYAAMKERYERNDFTFDPDVLILDGVYFIKEWERREKVISMFKSLCDKTHTTLIVGIEDPGDLYDGDHVITILEPLDFSPNQELEAEIEQPREKWSNLITGGMHSTLFTHSNEHKRARYRHFLNRLRDAISRNKRKRTLHGPLA